MNINQWLSFFNEKDAAKKLLENDYGKDYGDFKSKCSSIVNLLNLHLREFGNEEIIIIRVPGRINLMGRHIDHQGGNVNLIAIDREIFITASLRTDKKIIATNIEEKQFLKIEFEYSGYYKYIQREWVEIIKDQKIYDDILILEYDWSKYFKAALLRFINFQKRDKIKGMNCCVFGSIPIAAGLSSSSALTVGILEALINLNNINLSKKEIINLCAEAEWFVGTRGGAGDHVAIECAKLSEISHVTFKDLKLIGYVEFPKNCELLLCDTHVTAEKSGNKKDLFNEKVLAYEIGFNLIKQKFPKYSNKLNFLRDITPENLEMTSMELLRYIIDLPEVIQYNKIQNLLPKISDDLIQKYIFNKVPLKLPIQGVIMYGISECERSKVFYKFLKDGKVKKAAHLMYLSHEGDSVVDYDSNNKSYPHIYEIADDFINNKEGKLYKMAGGYGCSIAEIDFIVSLAARKEGVFGSQLSGGGFGGCAMILVEKSESENVKEYIRENYKKRYNKNCSIYVCKPVNGCSIYK